MSTRFYGQGQSPVFSIGSKIIIRYRINTVIYPVFYVDSCLCQIFKAGCGTIVSDPENDLSAVIVSEGTDGFKKCVGDGLLEFQSMGLVHDECILVDKRYCNYYRIIKAQMQSKNICAYFYALQ